MSPTEPIRVAFQDVPIRYRFDRGEPAGAFGDLGTLLPMCHGAGGMAGHIAFGGRTGGAPILLGSLLLFLALFFSSSVAVVFRMVPPEVLGVILFLAGTQLALGSCDFSKDKGERFTTVLTAGLAMWNIGIAFVLGLAVYYAFKRRWIRV